MGVWSVIAFFFLASCYRVASAQPYVEGGETRFRFATMYLGADVEYLPSGGNTFFNDSKIPLPSQLTTRLTIGGLHFWGHADFYLVFPIPPAGLSQTNQQLTTYYSTGVETGARVYPWRIEEGRIRPFAGAAWSILSYAQEHQEDYGPTVIKHQIPLYAGISYLMGPLLLEAGGMWLPRSSFSYPMSRTKSNEITLSPFNTWLGVKYLFDVTTPAEYAYEKGIIDTIEKRLAPTGELNSFTLAAGPSSAFTLSSSSYNEERRPYLEDRLPAVIFPDLSVGYYHYGLDATLNVSYRSITQPQSAYGMEQELSRKALSVEAMKFLFDYHGFVPFVGLTLNHDDLHVIESDNDVLITNEKKSGWSPGVIFGWDIRPTRLDWFLLRTNLRYAPGLKMEVRDRTVNFDHLEFNFIQFVFYPNRVF